MDWNVKIGYKKESDCSEESGPAENLTYHGNLDITFRKLKVELATIGSKI